MVASDGYDVDDGEMIEGIEEEDSPHGLGEQSASDKPGPGFRG